MRTVTYGAACSLDGFIAGPDGSVDWLHYSKDVQKIMATYWKTVDTMLIGRKTWEVGQRMAAEQGVDAGGPVSGITTYLFSRTMRSAPAPDTHLVSSDAGRRISLDLTEARTLDGGCVYSTYRVKQEVAAVSSAEGQQSVRRAPRASRG